MTLSFSVVSEMFSDWMQETHDGIGYAGYFPSLAVSVLSG